MEQIILDEWEAWHAIVRATETLSGKNFNGEATTPLVVAIKRWGMLYHQLREQFPEKE